MVKKDNDMSIRARERRKSGIYHFKGANRQDIFNGNKDCQRFLETLERYKKKSEIKVHGWCLILDQNNL
jgi:hypothetical protein